MHVQRNGFISCLPPNVPRDMSLKFQIYWFIAFFYHKRNNKILLSFYNTVLIIWFKRQHYGQAYIENVKSSFAENRSIPPVLMALMLFSPQVMQMYLPFCGIAISNAQLFAASRKEYERSRVSRKKHC